MCSTLAVMTNGEESRDTDCPVGGFAVTCRNLRSLKYLPEMALA